jgi:hypothetical protein
VQFTQKSDLKILGQIAMRVKTVNAIKKIEKTVGCVYSRDRLVHPWVPEMVLNVQSKFLFRPKPKGFGQKKN